MKKYNYIDLFAGCGGLTDGFEQTNKYKPFAFVEWDKNAVNNKVLHFDIQRMDELLNGFDDKYSIAGRVQDKNDMKCDYRNYLFENYLKVVKEFKPKIFVFENVQGILSAKPDGIHIIDRIRDDFEKEGYIITKELKSVSLLDSSDYGVPQVRKRVIIIGINKNFTTYNPQDILNDFYLNILPSFKVNKKVTVKESIGDLEPLYPLNEDEKEHKKRVSHYNQSKIKNHLPRFFDELALDNILIKIL